MNNLFFSKNHKSIYLLTYIFVGITLYLLINSSNLSAQQTFVKSPYMIFNNDKLGMRLLWQNNDSVACAVILKDSISADEKLYRNNENNQFHQHIINFDSLQAGHTYLYSVECDKEIRRGSFQSRQDTNFQRFSFLAYGDTRTYPENHNRLAEQMYKLIKSNNTYQTFVVATGDIVANGDNEEDWDNQFFDPKYKGIQALLANMPYMSAMGNHEGQGDLFQKYFPYDYNSDDVFYYSFDYGIAHFIIIDQFDDYSIGSKQYRWIIDDLKRNKSKWNIAVMHKPGYTAGGHKNSKKVQRILQPIFKKYNIKLVLTGHNHYYSRAEVEGVTHITTGGGGAPLYMPRKKKNIITIDRSFHFCKIDVSMDSLVISAIRSDGSQIEKFTINR